MADLKALIFDVDGTLADTERDGHLVSFNRAFADLGLDWCWSDELYGELLAVSGSRERICHYAQQYHPEFEPDEGLAAFSARLKDHKTAHYIDIITRDALPLRPGIRHLIDDARDARMRLAIATTTSLDNVIALLDHSLDANAADWFEVIGAGDMIAAKKPAPDIYRLVLKQLDLPAAECLALEDSGNGLASARTAGVPTAVIPCDYSRQHNFDGAMVVFDPADETFPETFTLSNLRALHSKL